MSAQRISFLVRPRPDLPEGAKPWVDKAFANVIRECCREYWDWGLTVVEDCQTVLYRFAVESVCRNRAEMLREDGVMCEVEYLGKDGR